MFKCLIFVIKHWPWCFSRPEWSLFFCLNLVGCQIYFTSLFLFSQHPIHFSLSLFTCHTVYTHSVGWVRSGKAGILTAERERESELWEGNRRHASVLVARYGAGLWHGPSICHFLTPSLALTGHGNGSLWRMTNLPLVMNETPPPECQEGAC